VFPPEKSSGSPLIVNRIALFYRNFACPARGENAPFAIVFNRVFYHYRRSDAGNSFGIASRSLRRCLRFRLALTCRQKADTAHLWQTALRVEIDSANEPQANSRLFFSCFHGTMAT